MMPLQIKYSRRAGNEYKQLLEYIIKNFGMAKAIMIDSIFEKILYQISANPFMYPLFHRKRNIRRCVISKQTTLYYRISGDYIELVSFRGNLMNPDKINFENIH